METRACLAWVGEKGIFNLCSDVGLIDEGVAGHADIDHQDVDRREEGAPDDGEADPDGCGASAGKAGVERALPSCSAVGQLRPSPPLWMFWQLPFNPEL